MESVVQYQLLMQECFQVEKVLRVITTQRRTRYTIFKNQRPTNLSREEFNSEQVSEMRKKQKNHFHKFAKSYQVFIKDADPVSFFYTAY